MTIQAVFTGAPGAGKTAILNALDDGSICGVPESAREVLSNSSGLELRDSVPEEFARVCFEIDLRKLKSLETHKQLAIFDRGFGDALGYYFFQGKVIPKTLKELATDNRYTGPVFDFRPWKEIYRQDEMRVQNFAEAVESHKAVIAAWRELGYRPIKVPVAGIDSRATWIGQQLF